MQCQIKNVNFRQVLSREGRYAIITKTEYKLKTLNMSIVRMTNQDNILNEEHSRPPNWQRHEWDQPAPISESDASPTASADPLVDDAPPAAHHDTQSTHHTSTWQAAIREILETVLLTLVIFWLVRIPTQTFRIEGSSMEPNLHEGQYLIVNKALYNWFREPNRGEIIVFRFSGEPRGHYVEDVVSAATQLGQEPADEYVKDIVGAVFQISSEPRKDYIKRVIGLPGETVEVRQGKVYINGELLQEPWEPNQATYTREAIELGPNQFYVLGDNRNNSSDSHTWGPVDQEQLIGKAWISYWPPNFSAIPPLQNWLTSVWDSYRVPKEWGLIPTYADPLKHSSANSASVEQPAQENAYPYP